jgi:hypothetical protein
MTYRKGFLENLGKHIGKEKKTGVPLSPKEAADRFLETNKWSSIFQGTESAIEVLMANFPYALFGFTEILENLAKKWVVEVAKGDTIDAELNKKSDNAIKWYNRAAILRTFTDLGFAVGIPLALPALGFPIAAGLGFASLGLLFTVPGILDRFSRLKQLDFVNKKVQGLDSKPEVASANSPVDAANMFLDSNVLVGMPKLFSRIEQYVYMLGGSAIATFGAISGIVNVAQGNVAEGLRGGMMVLGGIGNIIRGNMVSQPEAQFFGATAEFIKENRVTAKGGNSASTIIPAINLPASPVAA